MSSKSKVGGLVGRQKKEGSIKTSFAIGPVSGNKESGGLVGAAEMGTTIRDSYWDTSETGMEHSAVLPDAFGSTTSEMTGDAASQNIQEFDFQNIWKTTTSIRDYEVCERRTLERIGLRLGIPTTDGFSYLYSWLIPRHLPPLQEVRNSRVRRGGFHHHT